MKFRWSRIKNNFYRNLHYFCTLNYWFGRIWKWTRAIVCIVTLNQSLTLKLFVMIPKFIVASFVILLTIFYFFLIYGDSLMSFTLNEKHFTEMSNAQTRIIKLKTKRISRKKITPKNKFNLFWLWLIWEWNALLVSFGWLLLLICFEFSSFWFGYTFKSIIVSKAFLLLCTVNSSFVGIRINTENFFLSSAFFSFLSIYVWTIWFTRALWLKFTYCSLFYNIWAMYTERQFYIVG